LIEFLVVWFELKYPKREFDYYDGIRHMNIAEVDKLSKFMTWDQLMFRLSNEEWHFIKGCYRSNFGGNEPIYDKNGVVVDYRSVVSMKIKPKSKEDVFLKRGMKGLLPEFLVSADVYTGKLVRCYDIEDIFLEDLLEICRVTKEGNLDFSELEKCVLDHQVDLELRRKILELVALYLLYSPNTIPERGYTRAVRFILECNKHIEGLDLSQNRIDEIMNRNYKKKEKEDFFVEVKDEYSKKKSGDGFVKKLVKKLRCDI